MLPEVLFIVQTFLQDSTGISESMRKIYKYRQKIIKLQRFIRGWLDMQYARVQVRERDSDGDRGLSDDSLL